MNTTIVSTSSALGITTGNKGVTTSESTAESVVMPTDGPAPGTDRVSLSGHSLLLSRVFETDDGTSYNPVTMPRGGDSAVLGNYLTTPDRDLLEKIYQYASSNNIDLRHVDALAEDLGSYRAFGKSSEPTGLYDVQGHRLTMSFNASEGAIAQRIRGSGLASQSSLDQGFLQSELGAGGRLANLAFVEEVISVFSSDPSSAPKTQGPNVPLAQYDRQLSRFEVTASREVELVIPEADYSNVDGVGKWRTPELAAANGSPLGRKGPTSELLSLLERFGSENNFEKQRLTTLLEFFEPQPNKDKI